MGPERYYQTILKNDLASRMEKNPHYSLRSYARGLGVNAATLSKILSGKQRLTPELADKIVPHIQLGPEEILKFYASVAEAYADPTVKRRSPEVKSLLNRSGYEVSELETNGLREFFRRPLNVAIQVDVQKLGMAKKLIQKFMQDFKAAMEPQGEEVYELQIQFRPVKGEE